MNGKKSCLNCRWHDVFKWIIFLEFKKFFPKRVRDSREFYIRTCPTEKLIDIIHNLIRWNKPIPGVFFENTDAEDKKAIETWLQEEFKGE